MIFLGIDSGTQSTKTIALDADSGAILAEAKQNYGLLEGLPSGHMEQGPDTWTDAAGKTVEACLAQLGGRRSEVKGIGVSGQQHGSVFLGADDRPVRPAKLWCDTSTSEQCDQFARHFGGHEGLIELAGNAVLPGFTAPKILWLKQHEPQHFDATRSILLPHDYLNFWLTGRKRMEYGDASGTALLDVRQRTWQADLIAFIDPRVAEMLPEVGSSCIAHGTLKPELARQWHLGEDLVVSAGGGDNMMGAIGTGNVKPGVITASLGTSGTLYGAADHPVTDSQGEIAAFCDSTDLWLPLMCTMNVTVLTERTRLLFDWDHEQLEEEIRQTPAGAGGLIFLPYLNGERTPNLPNGRAVLYGLTGDTMTRGHLARSAMEGVSLGLAYGMKRFTELGVKPKEIRLTGGGSNSATWRQIMADATGAETVCLQTAEGASLGAAIQAAACHFWNGSFDRDGIENLTHRLVELDEATRCRPQPEWHALYAEQMERQLDLTRELHQGNWI